MLPCAAMSDEKKFDWPELPYHRATLKSVDADAESRVLAAQQIHTGIVHGVGGDCSNARSPKPLAHELVRELCDVLEGEIPDLLSREVVWQIAHIFHEGTDARFSPPKEEERELAETLEKHLQHDNIRNQVRRWIMETLQMVNKREFASSLSCQNDKWSRWHCTYIATRRRN